MIYPADNLGVADRIGLLEAGKDATLIVTTGDPLGDLRRKSPPPTSKGARCNCLTGTSREKYKEKYQQYGRSRRRYRATTNC